MRRLPWSCVAILATLLPGCGSEADVLLYGTTQLLDAGAESGSAGTFSVAPGSLCQAGPYIGTFIGFWDPALMNDQSENLTGEIAFTLEPTLSREFLQITTSDVEGEANDSIQFRFRVDGHSGCSSGEFSADIVDGVWTINETERGFYGEITGDYTIETERFDGDWWIADSTFGIPLVSGEWFATFDLRSRDR